MPPCNGASGINVKMSPLTWYSPNTSTPPPRISGAVCRSIASSNSNTIDVFTDTSTLLFAGVTLVTLGGVVSISSLDDVVKLSTSPLNAFPE